MLTVSMLVEALRAESGNAISPVAASLSRLADRLEAMQVPDSTSAFISASAMVQDIPASVPNLVIATEVDDEEAGSDNEDTVITGESV